MSTAPAGGGSHGWGRLVRIAVAVFMIQLLLIWVLSRRSPPGPELAGQRGVAWVWQGAGVAAVAPGVPDAAVFAVVQGAGFTGQLWNRPGGPRGAPTPSGLAERLRAGVNLRRASQASGVVPSPEAPVIPVNVRVPMPEFAGGQEWEGAGEGARLRLPPALKGTLVTSAPGPLVWTNAEVLGPTAVRLLVGADGGVLSATLIDPGSGLPAADQRALEYARGMRFARSAEGGLAGVLWSEVEFVWRTISAPSPAGAGGRR